MNTLLYDCGDIIECIEMESNIQYYIKVIGSTRILDIKNNAIYKNRQHILSNYELLKSIQSNKIYNDERYEICEHNWAELFLCYRDKNIEISMGIIDTIKEECDIDVYKKPL